MVSLILIKLPVGKCKLGRHKNKWEDRNGS
jgi:hypothetical protein